MKVRVLILFLVAMLSQPVVADPTLDLSQFCGSYFVVPGLPFQPPKEIKSLTELLAEMNDALIRDLVGNRIGGLNFDAMAVLKESGNEMPEQEAYFYCRDAIRGFAIYQAGVSPDKTFEDVSPEERIAIYINFLARTVDEESVRTGAQQEWYRNEAAFRRSEFSSREMFPNDPTKLKNWLTAALAWHAER